MSAPLILLQLSDIHFRYSISNGPYDLDEVIRHELLHDATTMAPEAGGFDAILVVGDIAFAAREDEYDIAYAWLNRLATGTRTPLSKVWTVPGNHDIDRSKITTNALTQMQRTSMRDITIEDLDDQIRKHLEDAQARNLLFAPIEQYNAFATKLGTVSTPAPLYWEKDLQLNDGSILRVRGLNSVLISDPHDSDEERRLKLILSSHQTTFLRHDGVAYATMCHHPLEWLRDVDNVEDWLDSHARIQMFGHRHRQRVKQVADNIRIASGAIQPDRGEPGWEPRFNIVQVEVVFDNNNRKLKTSVDPRIWNDTEKRFVRDSLGIYTRALPLPEWKPVSSSEERTAALPVFAEPSSVVAAIAADLEDFEIADEPEKGRFLNAGATLTTRYISLPSRLQKEVATKLELVNESDEGVSTLELYRRYFRRAKERKQLERLWNEVEAIYVARGEEPSKENPFVGV
jgi:hypothetical protein